MPRLTESSRQQRRQAIAAAAMRCFARDGFANTSMADIIKEAGSSAGSVYSHFAGKAELLRFAAGSAVDDLIATVSDELPSERTPASVVSHLIQASGDPAHAQMLLEIWAEAPRDPDLLDISRQSLNQLRELVRTALLPWCEQRPSAGPARPTAAALADAVVAAIQGFLVTVSIDRDGDADALAAHVVEVFERL